LPVLAIIAAYAVPTAERLVAVGTVGAGFVVAPSMDSHNKVCMSFFRQPIAGFPTIPNVETDIETDILARFYGVPDPIEPIYYSFDADLRKIIATNRLSGKLAVWLDRIFGDFDDRLPFCCPSTGVIYALDTVGFDSSIYRLTRDTVSSLPMHRQSVQNGVILSWMFDSSNCGAMVGRPDGTELYINTTVGPYRIQRKPDEAILSPLLSKPPNGNSGASSHILVLLPNGLLLTQFWRNVADNQQMVDWIVVDPSGFDHTQRIMPAKPPSLRMESVVCSRGDVDLLYFADRQQTLYELHLSSDLRMNMFDLK
jgi:hypothetical protein